MPPSGALLVWLLLMCGLTSAACARDCGSCTCEPFSDAVRCSGSHLESIPQDLPLNITYLVVEHTSITELNNSSFSSYDQLTHLYIRRNELLTNISESTFFLNSDLSELAITNNPHLEFLDDYSLAGSFTHLKYLNLSNNALRELPDLSRLELYGTTLSYYLYLDGNPLDACDSRTLCPNVDIEGVTGLLICSFTEITIKWTQMTGFSKRLLQNAAVDILDLSHNEKLSTIDDDAFSGISKKLHTLILSENTRLTNLPSIGLQDLRVLKFTNCPLIKTIPHTTNYFYIQEVHLTYSQHCCAFKRPELQDKKEYDQVLNKYENEECNKNKGLPTMPSRTFPPTTASPFDDSDFGLLDYSDFSDYSEFPDEEFFLNFHRKRRDTENIRRARSFKDFVTKKHNGESSTTRSPSLPQFFDSTIDPSYNHIVTFSTNCTQIDFELIRDQMVCLPAENSFTPCVDILEKNWLRGILWVVAVSAVIGNFLVLLFTIASQMKTPMTVTKFLICNLAFADAMLGTYLLAIAAVDIKSMGQYFNFATWWQYEGGCDAIGFITIFASELSVYTLSVITFERWYAISHAIHLTKRMSMRQAIVTMAVGWCVSIILAALPLHPELFSSYQPTSICLPFKYDTITDKGYILFLLAINTSAFILVFCCYVSIFCQVRGSNASRNNDTYLARRMALLVFTDFICWGPVAIVAGLSAGGVNMQETLPSASAASSLFIAKVILVIFYPFNACANPFLYAIATQQFQKDCIVTLNQCGLCHGMRARKRWRRLFGHHEHSDSQWSTKNQTGRHLSATYNATTSTQLTSDNRGSLKSCTTVDNRSASRRSGDLNDGHSASNAALHAVALKVFNSQASHTSSRGKDSLDYSVYSRSLSDSIIDEDSMTCRRTSDDCMTTGHYYFPSNDSDQAADTTFTERQPDITRPRTLSKQSDHDSGTEINHLSGSEADELLPLTGAMVTDEEATPDITRVTRGRQGSYKAYDEDELLKHSKVDADNNIKLVANRNMSNPSKEGKGLLRRASNSSSNRASSVYEDEVDTEKVRLTDSAVVDCE